MFRAILITLFFFMLVLVGGIWLLWKLLGNFSGKKIGFSGQPGSLREAVNARVAAGLTTWDGESFGLLAMNATSDSGKNPFKNGRTGLITSIYQEPMAAWALAGSMENGELLVRNSEHEFFYRLKGREVEIRLDDLPFCTLINGILLDGDRRAARQIGRLENATELGRDVFFNDRRLATIVEPGATKRMFPKALDGLREPFSEDEKRALAAVVFLEILKRTR